MNSDNSQIDGSQAAAPDAGWLARNGPYLILFAALVAFLRYKNWDLLDFWNLFKVVIGLGLVIFIHELGHFLVAKWCDVHVETFSIGFGPPLPGCCFRWGETTYMIALFPLGGYVKMVGEGAENDDSDTDPRSFKNKSVYQRMAIISAGVIMNVLLAFACFVFVFMTRGAEQIPGIIDFVDAGSPAWKVGARTGDIIHQVGREAGDPPFEKLQAAIMRSKNGEALPFVFSPPGTPRNQWTDTKVLPRRDDDDLKPVIGFGFPRKLELWPERTRRSRESPVLYDSPAYRAKPSFEFGDQIIGCTDPDQSGKVTELPIDPRDPSHQQHDYFVFGERLKRLEGQEIVVRVRRAGEDPHATPREEDITVPPAYRYQTGMRMHMGKITAVRDGSAAAQAGVQEGDEIVGVEVTGAAGKILRYVSSRSTEELPKNVEQRDLDPERLPFELEQWAKEQGSNREVKLTLIRKNPLPQDGRLNDHKEERQETITLKWDDSWRFNKEVPLGPSAPMAVPELGLAYQIENRVVEVRPDSPAAKAGIQAGDVISEVRFFSRGKKSEDEPKPDPWVELKSHQWASLHYILSMLDVPKMDLKIARDKVEHGLDLTPDSSWPQVERGLILMPDRRLQKADGFLQAIGMGIDQTKDFIEMIFDNLRGFATGRLSPRLLAGPVTIGTAAFSIAGANIYDFIKFLGVIGVNLAVINFLPIPVLDGGHMVFLIYEKLRGRPASEQVRVAATYLGLAFIACLMLFVLYLDVTRLLRGT